MRVIHVAPTSFGPKGIYGGGERYPIELVRALSKHIDCELVTFAQRPDRFQRVDGVKVRSLRAVRFLGGHPAQPLAPNLPAALSGASLVHFHHLRSLPAKIGATAAMLRRQPRVVTDHGLQGRNWRGALIRLFDRFLTVSRYSAQELTAPPDRTRVIYGGADPRRFKPYPAVARSGVLFVGRITPHKGVDRLIKSLPGGACLRVAGSSGHDPEPPERAYPQLLRELAEGSDVQFLGPVPDQHLPSLYRQAAVLVLPSVERTCYGREIKVSELLGLAVLEAMASGTPVVCSRLGGVSEIVEDGVSGLLVTPGDEDELRESIAQVLSDRSLAEKLGRNGRELVLERFTWDACAERCLNAYAELVA